MTGDASTIARAAVAEAEALEALTRLAGDASMCAVSREGRAVPAAKYYEGAASALGDVRRGGDAGIGAVMERWRLRAQHGVDTESWRAYHAGALDALLSLGGGKAKGGAPFGDPASHDGV